jgi:hypothetical protein
MDSEVADGVGVGATAGFATATPLLQMSFFPDFTQVKVFPEETEVLPALGQEAPALTAANAGIDIEVPKIEITIRNASFRFIWKGYLSKSDLSVTSTRLL